ncbi:putative phosphoenolpyruvate synthase [Operophtera brumata]|uniref:Putative phosphoenolpyruvate synthase n=1 Tax=Operophtera brumata TaxID=104452 RepID=A0A0L7LTX6_OPEBR|nr:putative phosphoenolpyruvate synthase [Operophtera brumata]
MANFCETAAEIPKIYSINVSSNKRDLKVVLRINSDGGKMPSGVPHQHEVLYRTVLADIDGFAGSGVMEAGRVEHCLPFEDRRAACADLVGGKGASLALLASMQNEEGYKVPPGFCLTINALDKHLEQNPALQAAILEVEAASSLFATTELSGDVKEEILANIAELRTKASEQNLGPELRFANETVLGCASDDDILRGILKCWGSMQNGQPCLCGGGVVIQALVSPRAAGVMFTRHPAHGDPSRLLITANFGLGEACLCGGGVVIQALVSPRAAGVTFTRHPAHGDPSHLLITANFGLGEACLCGGEVVIQALVSPRAAGVMFTRHPAYGDPSHLLITANFGLGEACLCGGGVVIQALVSPRANGVMFKRHTAHGDPSRLLITANLGLGEACLCGGGVVIQALVSPRAAGVTFTRHPVHGDPSRLLITANFGLGESVVSGAVEPDTFIIKRGQDNHLFIYKSVLGTKSQRITVNSDKGVGLEDVPAGERETACLTEGEVMSLARLGVAQEELWAAARDIEMSSSCCKLVRSRHWSDGQRKNANAMVIGEGVKDPYELWQCIADTEARMMKMSYNHSVTSTASTCKFSPELCNEIGTLLSSGDVLSAEVPQGLASLARSLEASGKYDEFRGLQPQEAMAWLQTHLPNFELSTKPWVLVPEDMMKIRLAFLRLGQALVKQWYLPNVDLVFFFRFKELGDYIQTRDPGLLRNQRQQYYPGWCKLKFAEINQGWVQPLAARRPAVTADDVRIEAATVCGGEVVARACVVKDISEGWVQPLAARCPAVTAGDVRIEAATVCGGEVVARAYATDIFRTGDIVRLSGNKGTLERVVLLKPEQNEHAVNSDS